MRGREENPWLLGLKEDLCFTFDIPWRWWVGVGEALWAERTIDSFPTEAAKT